MNRRTPLLAALLLALCPLAARAADARIEPLYPAPAAPWETAVGGLAPAAGLAPVVAQLENQLQLTPAAFAALPATERRTALDLAQEAAHDDLMQKTAGLIAETHELSSPDKTLDGKGRARLYRIVAQLDELRTQYGRLLQPQELEIVSDSYRRASSRAWEIRNALLAQSLKNAAAAAAPAFIPPPPGKAARDLAASMRNNAVGWKLRDLDALLTGYGFKLQPGSKHRKYEFPGLKPQTVPHQTQVDPSYIRNALAAIAQIDGLRAPAPNANARAAVPAKIDLDQLAILLDEPAHAPKTKP